MGGESWVPGRYLLNKYNICRKLSYNPCLRKILQQCFLYHLPNTVSCMNEHLDGLLKEA